MSKNQVQDQTIVESIQETDEEKYQRLLSEAGLVKQPKEELLSPEAKVEKVKQLLTLLEVAKESKDEKAAKKIRRTLRKKFSFKISEHKKVVVQA